MKKMYWPKKKAYRVISGMVALCVLFEDDIRKAKKAAKQLFGDNLSVTPENCTISTKSWKELFKEEIEK